MGESEQDEDVGLTAAPCFEEGYPRDEIPNRYRLRFKHTTRQSSFVKMRRILSENPRATPSDIVRIAKSQGMSDRAAKGAFRAAKKLLGGENPATKVEMEDVIEFIVTDPQLLVSTIIYTGSKGRPMTEGPLDKKTSLSFRASDWIDTGVASE